MMDRHTPFDPAALERSVPRYTSYPTAPHFSASVTAEAYASWLAALPPGKPISLYVHVPFCDDLCWFCACRTQGTKRYAMVARYLEHLAREIEIVATHVPAGQPVSHLHWGGGSPTVLSAEDMAWLKGHLTRHFPGVAKAEFAVEIDPRDITPAKLDALAAAGLDRASIGVQDFDPAVQAAIGRMQGEEMTREVIEGLRARGVESINIDLLYGLPAQTERSLRRTIMQVVALEPDRLALFGYAHVPWMAKRQKMIAESTLPSTEARRAQARLARRALLTAGYEAIGIDHFARPTDRLAIAAREGHMRRNFQGYTVDDSVGLVGLGASAIASLPGGYAQNDPTTATYQLAVEAGRLPIKKGVALAPDDMVRREAIEQILCSFALDLDGLRARYGAVAGALDTTVDWLLEIAPAGALTPWRGGFRVAEAWHVYARLIAAEFDAYLKTAPARHSLAV